MDAVESLIADIRVAFRGVPRGETTLREAEAIDTYHVCTPEMSQEARRLDTDGAWDRVPDRDIEEFSSALCFVDLQSWKYYVPAYMIWSLRNSRTSSSMSSDGTIYTFSHFDETQPSGSNRDKYSALNHSQVDCVVRFLQHMAKNDDFADAKVAQSALNDYWLARHSYLT